MTSVDGILLNLPLANFIYAFQESNMPGKLIVLLLFIGSIFAWTIMVTKISELSRARRMTRGFLFHFRKEVNPLALFARRQKFVDSPLYRLYDSGCKALGTELETVGHNPDDLFATDYSADAHRLDAQQLDRLRSSMEQNLADQSLILERRMNVLATAATTAPFLGLLGTVWGVMDAFTGMAVLGTATLSAVAPGIAAALMTTVMGLLVALPSAIGYNVLSGQIAELQVQSSNFAKEFMDKVHHQFSRIA